MNKPIIIEQVYEASIEKTWNALTDKALMKQWYFDIAEFKPEAGFIFSFEAGPPDMLYLHKCEILEVVEQQKLQYTWTYPGYEGLSYVTFELFPHGNKTQLRLTHEGVESFPKDNTDMVRENFVEGWNQITGQNLKKFLEG